MFNVAVAFVLVANKYCRYVRWGCSVCQVSTKANWGTLICVTRFMLVTSFSLVFSHTIYSRFILPLGLLRPIFHELRNLKHCRNCQSTNGGVNAWFKSKLLIVPCSAWLFTIYLWIIIRIFLCSDEDQPYHTLDAN